MASYTVQMGHIGAHRKTLTADDVDQVTFDLGVPDTPGWQNLPKAIEILTDGTADIFVTFNGDTPVVDGPACWRIPNMPGATVLDVRDAGTSQPLVVKLISSGTPTYSVSRAT